MMMCAKGFAFGAHHFLFNDKSISLTTQRKSGLFGAEQNKIIVTEYKMAFFKQK